MTASPRAPRWLHVALATITIGLLALFARDVDWQRAWNATTDADAGLLALAIVANLASLLVKGVRWSLFLDAAGLHGAGAAVRATFAGAALNNVLVANGGDAARVAALARRRSSSSACVLATLVVDRACDLITYIVLLVVAAFVLPVPAELSRWRAPVAGALVIILGVARAIAWRATRSRTPSVTGERGTSLSRIRGYWRELAATTGDVITSGRMSSAIALSFAAWAGQWATFHYAARSVGFDVAAATSLVALLLVNASFVIRLTPGNVGVFQVLYSLATTAAGFNRDDAIAVAFLIQVIQYIPVTLIGLLLAPSLVRRPTASTPDRMRVRGDSELGA